MVQSHSTSSQHQPPKLLEQVCEAIRARHYSLRTEATYLSWIKRFILFHGKRHPREMGGTGDPAVPVVSGRGRWCCCLHAEPRIERHRVSLPAGPEADYWLDRRLVVRAKAIL